ncbi:hypothetical protein HDU97_005041 [Phlyctochytrium planicorne]|nr:hypothetical protein HDU97_005041 [Phlyctochytrium planicorne]
MSSAETLTLHVKTLAGKPHIPITTTPASTILSIKEEITKTLDHLSVSSMRLIKGQKGEVKAREMGDDEIVKDVGFENDEIIHLVLRLPNQSQ